MLNNIKVLRFVQLKLGINVGRGSADFSSMTKLQLLTHITFLENRNESMKSILEECQQNLFLARQRLHQLKQDEAKANGEATTPVSTDSMPCDEPKAESQTNSTTTYEEPLINGLSAFN